MLRQHPNKRVGYTQTNELVATQYNQRKAHAKLLMPRPMLLHRQLYSDLESFAGQLGSAPSPAKWLGLRKNSAGANRLVRRCYKACVGGGHVVSGVLEVFCPLKRSDLYRSPQSTPSLDSSFWVKHPSSQELSLHTKVPTPSVTIQFGFWS